MITLTRRYRFPAAHVLAHPDLSPQENRRIYGKCANPHGHGHDYGVEVSVAGAPGPRSGELCPREVLDELVGERVLARLSHTLLNRDPAFREQVPTAENIARFIFSELRPAIEQGSDARLVKVAVVETRKNRFEVEEQA